MKLIVLLLFVQSICLYSQTPKKIVTEFCKGNINYVVNCAEYPVEGVYTNINSVFYNKKELEIQLREWYTEITQVSKNEKNIVKIIYRKSDKNNVEYSVQVNNIVDGQWEGEYTYIFSFKKKKGLYKIFRITSIG